MGKGAFILIFLSLAGSDPAFAQTGIAYSNAGASYTQNFDGLPASGTYSLTGKGPFTLNAAPINSPTLPGWQFWMPAGSNSNAVFAVSTGSSTGNGAYSFGLAASPDRALGSLAASSGIYSFGVIFTNTTGTALNTCTVSFTVEQWRKGGSGNRNTWAFRYKTGIISSIDQPGLGDEHALDLFSVQTTTTAAALNGNLPENQLPVSYTIRNINWKNGEQLLLRWDDADETGSDDACALDNFSFSAQQVTAPPLVSLLPATNITSNSATLNGTVNDNFARTVIIFEYDTSAGFSNPVSIRPGIDTIEQGAGNTAIAATVTNLQTGVSYYYRIKATNTAGSTSGNSGSFTTAFSLPVLATDMPAGITPDSVLFGGTISSTGGTAIVERGIVWSLSDPPMITGNKITIPGTTNHFTKTVYGLPGANTIFVRSYATNNVGTAYGNTQTLTTPTSVTSLAATGTPLSNASKLNFTGKTAHPIAGLTPANFAVVTNTIAGATVSSVAVTGNTFTVTVNTGTGDGSLLLSMISTAGTSVPVYNLPFQSQGGYIIDKTPPGIRSVSIPDNPAKIGDTVPVLIAVAPDTAVYRMTTGRIAGISATQFQRLNDSLYGCRFVIPNAGTDIPADASIPVNITLSDVSGNSASYTAPIIKNNDLIDANKPALSSIRLPADKLYKLGDTLSFTLFFNEKIAVSTLANPTGFSITVGSRTKFTAYVQGDGTDSINTRYIVQPGESDKDGIRVGSPISWLNGDLRDLAGNPAVLTVTVPSTKNILVDGVAPTISSITVPPPAVYRTGNLLDFVVNYSEKVWVEGIPVLTVVVGNEQRQAVYVSGSGGTALLFRYAVQAADQDKDGIKLLPALTTSLASIKDEAGNTASNTLSNIGALSFVLINLPSIAITGISVPPDSVYTAADTIIFSLVFNEKAFVKTATGVPSLKLTVGSSSKQALYTQGSGSNTLQFSYPVQPGDLDTNGIQLASSLSLNNGIIQDEFGNMAPAALGQLPATAGIRIDAVNPAVRSVVTPQKNTYHEGDTLQFVVTLTEAARLVTVADTPYIKLFAGPAQLKMPFTKGSGTALLLFSYLVKPGDLDKNGIRIDSVISNGAEGFKDMAGNTLLPQLRNVAAVSGIKIDAIAPAFGAADSLITICENAGPVNIAPLLRATDKEDNEELKWVFRLLPAHGSISKSALTGISNGHDLEPAAVLYKPAVNFSGTDTMLVELADGVHSVEKKIYLQMQSRIQNNTISAVPLACADVEVKPITATAPLGGDGIYKAVWESSVAGDSTGFAPAAGTSGIHQYAPGKLNTSTWFRRKIESGTCTSTSPAAKIAVLKTGFWTGRYDMEWNNSNNWCSNIIPGPATDIIIDGRSDFPALIRDSAKCGSLALQNDARLTVNGNLFVSGGISVSGGMIDARQGTIIFNGTAAQQISAGFLDTRIKQLVIDNAAGVSIASSLSVSNILMLRKGSLMTNNQLHLLHTARIGQCAAGTSISGQVWMDHLMPGGKRVFRLLGHPFKKDISLDMIKDSIDITGEGGAANGFTTTASNQPSAFFTDAAKTNDSSGIDAGWTAFANTASNGWKENTGIRLLVRGSKGQGLDSVPAGNGNNGTYFPNPVMLTMYGPVHIGDVDLRLQGHGAAAYHVIGNPYPSPVDLSKLSATGNIGRNYWAWDPGLGKAGGYCSYPFSSSNSVEPFNAIIVKTTDSAVADLLFTENCKSDTTTVSPQAHPDNSYFLELHLEADSILYDRFLLVCMDTARAYADRFDAEKFMNGEVNLYSLSRDRKILSIDYRPVSNESVIPLGLQTSIQHRFRLRFADVSLPAGNTLQLYDRYLNKWTRLEKDSSYAFETTGDTGSTGNYRFEISSWRKTVADTGISYKLVTRVSPQPANDRVTVQFSAPDYAATNLRLLNLSGRVLMQFDLGRQKSGQLNIPVANLLPGLYLLELRSGDHVSIQKMLKQ